MILENGSYNKSFSAIAGFLSYLLHPIFIPVIGIAIISFTLPQFNLYSLQTKLLFLSIMFSITGLLPGLIMLFRYYQQVTAYSGHIPGNERIVPLLIMAVTYFLCYFFLIRIRAPVILCSFLFAVFITTLNTALISRYFSISLHTTGWGGLIGLHIILVFYYGVSGILLLISLLILSGLTGSVRVITQSHTAFQVYAGFLNGVVLVFLTMFLFLAGFF